MPVEDLATHIPSSPADAIRWLREARIGEVECIVPDMNAIMRGKIIPREDFIRLIEDGVRLPEFLFFQAVTGDTADESSIVNPLDRDVRAIPDLSTMRLVPWYEELTRPGHLRLRLHGRIPGRFRPAPDPAQGPRALCRAGIEAGCRPGTRVLPHRPEQRPGHAAERAGGIVGTQGIRPPGLRHRTCKRLRPRRQPDLRLLRVEPHRDCHRGARGRPGPIGNELPPRRSDRTGRPDLPVQAHRTPCRAQAQHGRHLHGHALSEHAGLRHPYPSVDRASGARLQSSSSMPTTRIRPRSCTISAGCRPTFRPQCRCSVRT